MARGARTRLDRIIGDAGQIIALGTGMALGLAFSFHPG